MEIKNLQKIWSTVEKYGNVHLCVNLTKRDLTQLSKDFKITNEPFGYKKFEFKTN